jgi:hypothetical protein
VAVVNVARFIPIVAVAGLLVAATQLDDDLDPAPPAQFGSVNVPPMPVAPTGTPLSSSWFCPGVPAGSPDAGTGTVSVLNASDTPIDGTLTVYRSEGEAVSAPIAVDERSRTDVRLSEIAPSPWAAAVVELLGTEGVVEQTVVGPMGRSVTACANAAAPTWYLADGATTVDAAYSLLLFNPFPDDAIVDVAFATTEGTRTPQALQGYPIRGRSLRVVNLAEVVRREPTVATKVTARSGRVVAARVQAYLRGTKRGLSVGLASPEPAEQWWFATGDKSERAAERVTIFNPGEADAEVDVSFFPSDPAAPLADPVNVTVPAGTTAVVDVNASEGVPDGQHSILVLSEEGRPVIVERTLDLQGDTALNVTMQPGSPLVSTLWTLVTGLADGAEALVIANTTGVDAGVTVSSLGPAGFTPLTGLDDVTLAAAGTLRVDLDELGAAGIPISVEATEQVAVERIVGAPVGQTGISIARGIPTP